MANKKNDPETDKGYAISGMDVQKEGMVVTGKTLNIEDEQAILDAIKKKPKKMVEVELTETIVKYDFSQDELVAIGEDVADFAQKLALLEAEAKQIAKKYKADIEGVALKQDHFIRLIRDKFEMRKMECFKVIDGKLRKAYFFRADEWTAEDLYKWEINQLTEYILKGDLDDGPARIRDARPSELQRELPMDQPEGEG